MKSASKLIALAAVWLLCVPQASAGQGATIKKMAKHYAKTFDCGKDELTITMFPGTEVKAGLYQGGTYQVSGCDKETIVTGIAVGGPFFYFDDLVVRKRAPIDLECADSPIEYTHLDAKTILAVGCDKKATYVYTGEVYNGTLGSDVPGTWALN